MDSDIDESGNDNSNNKKRRLHTDSSDASEEPPKKKRKLNTWQEKNKRVELFKQIMKDWKGRIAAANRLCVLYRTKMEAMEKHYLKELELVKEAGRRVTKERDLYKDQLRIFMDLMDNKERKEDGNESTSIIDGNNTNNAQPKPKSFMNSS
eukprot:340356_1